MNHLGWRTEDYKLSDEFEMPLRNVMLAVGFRSEEFTKVINMRAEAEEMAQSS